MEWQESFSINIHCNSEPDLNDPQWMASQVVQGPVSREEEEETAADGGWMVVWSASKDVEIGRDEETIPRLFQRKWRFYTTRFSRSLQTKAWDRCGKQAVNIIRHPIKPLILTADRGMTPVSHWYPQSCDERGWAGYQDKQIFGTVGHMKSWMVLMHLAFRFLWPLRGGMVLSCLHPWIF